MRATHRAPHRRIGSHPNSRMPSSVAKRSQAKAVGNGESGSRSRRSSSTLVGGAMHPRIDTLAPGVRLTIEIIDIGEGDSCPEALLDDANRPLDLALRLGRPSLA